MFLAISFLVAAASAADRPVDGVVGMAILSTKSAEKTDDVTRSTTTN